MSEVITISSKGFLDYLKTSHSSWRLFDSLTYYNRMHSAKNSTEEQWRSVLEELKSEGHLNNQDAIDRYALLHTLLHKDSDVGSNLVYTDKCLGVKFVSYSLVDKFGYTSYSKDKATWYDLSCNLSNLLAILCGTRVEVIDNFLETYLSAYHPDWSLDFLSKLILSSPLTPQDIMLELNDFMCPSITNLFQAILRIGDQTGYNFCGNSMIMKHTEEQLTEPIRTNFLSNRYSYSTMSNDTQIITKSISDSALTNVYLISVLRFLEYYLLGLIHDTVYSKGLVGVSKEGMIRESTISWSHSDIVFQNHYSKDYPEFLIQGRNGVSFKLIPHTYSQKEAVIAYLEGEIDIV